MEASINFGGRRWSSKYVSNSVYEATAFNFKEELQEQQGMQFQPATKIKHANLPIDLISTEKMGDLDSIRVLEPPVGLTQETYTMKSFLMVYNHLVKVVAILHQKILDQLNITENEKTKRSIDVLNWIGQEISNPSKGYPVFGKISSNVDYSTLVGQMLVGQPLFGAVQLSMINYFSTSKAFYFPQAKSTAAFVLASWYQVNYPNNL